MKETTIKFIKFSERKLIILCAIFIISIALFADGPLKCGEGISGASSVGPVITFQLSKNFYFSPTDQIYITYDPDYMPTEEFSDNFSNAWIGINFTSGTNFCSFCPQTTGITLQANHPYHFSTNMTGITGIFLSEPSGSSVPSVAGIDEIGPQLKNIPTTPLVSSISNNYCSNVLTNNSSFNNQMQTLLNQQDNNPQYSAYTQPNYLTVQQDIGNVVMLTNLDSNGNLEAPQCYTSLPDNLPPASEQFFLYLAPEANNPASAWNFYYIETYLTKFLNANGISYVMIFDNGATPDNINNYLFSPNLTTALLLSHGSANSANVDSGLFGVGYGMDTILNYAKTNKKEINGNAAIILGSCYGFSNIGYALINSGATQVFGAYLTLDSCVDEIPHILTAATYALAQKENIKCSLTDSLYYVYEETGKNITNSFGEGIYACYDQKHDCNLKASSDFSVNVSKSKYNCYEWDTTITNMTSIPKEINTITVENAFPVMTCSYQNALINQEADIDNKVSPSIPVCTNLMMGYPSLPGGWTYLVPGITEDSEGNALKYNSNVNDGCYKNIDTTYSGNAEWSPSTPIYVQAHQSIVVKFTVIPFWEYTSIPYNNLQLLNNQVIINQN
ncbi:MAG: hypothetical protein NTX05_05495 [Fusobacteria bacterium]|nr:hypothetical protein [Fusobacteriota bacterium]